MKRISGHTVKSSQVVQSEQYFASAQTGYARMVIMESSSNTTYAGKRKNEPAESSMTERHLSVCRVFPTSLGLLEKLQSLFSWIIELLEFSLKTWMEFTGPTTKIG